MTKFTHAKEGELNICRRTHLIFSIFLSISCTQANQSLQKSQTAEPYIVVLNKTSLQVESLGDISISEAVNQRLEAFAIRHQTKSDRIFKKVLFGGVLKLTVDQAKEVAKDPAVAYVERDQLIHVQDVQTNVTWGLDRLDQVSLPLDHSYQYPSNGVDVNVYVIDTGILLNHQEFSGRAISGVDVVENDTSAVDCNGHGTHVAGTIGGQTYGVNKRARLIAVRVLDCTGSGSFSNVIAGIDWVAANHVGPSVANMSLGGSASQAVDDAVRSAIQSGVTFVVAGGNESQSACNSSPARVPEALTVGATNSADAKSDFSNFGNCLDVFAPGENITSAWYSNPTATNTISGTSMASPHVAGVASLYLAQHPTTVPSEVVSALIGAATLGRVSQAGDGSPNRLLNLSFLLGSGPQDPNPSDPDPNQPPVDPLPPKIKNHQVIPNLLGTKGSEIRYVVEVPKGARHLEVRIAGSSGDADLYLRAGSESTDSIYDCRPYTSTSQEYCLIEAPVQGFYYISIRGYSGYQGLQLSVSFEEGDQGGGPACLLCLEEDGRISTNRGSAFLPGAGYIWSGGVLNLRLSGPSSADFDLFLQRLENGVWVSVAQSISATSIESIRYLVTAGQYRIQVMSYSGTGAFHLSTQLKSL